MGQLSKLYWSIVIRSKSIVKRGVSCRLVIVDIKCWNRHWVGLPSNPEFRWLLQDILAERHMLVLVSAHLALHLVLRDSEVNEEWVGVHLRIPKWTHQNQRVSLNVKAIPRYGIGCRYGIVYPLPPIP